MESGKKQQLSELPVFTLDQVKQHKTEDDCWIAHMGKVYAIPRDFIFGEHPGGPIIMEVAGKDATHTFEDVNHGEGAREAMKEFLVGVLQK